jgi:hypothetical protein
VSVQPATRWAGPLPIPITLEGQWHRSHPSPAVPPEPAGVDEALLRLLLADLSRGHRRLAIRHYLMLKGRGAGLPTVVERRCASILQECPARQRVQISRDVENWLAMLPGTGPRRQF